MKNYRNCPKCNKKLYYSRKNSLYRANKNNTMCKKCNVESLIKFNFSNKGKTFEEKYGIEKAKVVRNKMKLSQKGKHKNFSEWNKYRKGKTLDDIYGFNKAKKIKNKIKKNHNSILKGKTYEDVFGKEKATDIKNKLKNTSKNNCFQLIIYNKSKKGKTYEKFYGFNKAKKIKIKQRMSAIKKIETNTKFQIHPGFNKSACQIIDSYGKKNGYKFQHAMNGGEWKIEELCRWVDGVDHKNKTIIEYYETQHKKQIEKDKQRIKEIKQFLPNYKIIILREWNNKIQTI